MKKSQLKGLKQLAEQLPKSVEIQVYSELKKGYEMTIEEIERAKIPIEAEEYYKKSGSQRLVEIHHYDRLKKAYARNREKGLVDYIEWLDKHNLRMNELFEKLELQRVSDEIMEVAKKGEKGFWANLRNLLNFLFAFINTFKKKTA